MARSEPGQFAPAPSAPQNVPNVVRSRPTPNLSVFSGTRESGARTAMPAATTTTIAAAAPAAASGMLPWLLPNVTTMKATSSPSRSTPLNAIVNAYQSMPAAAVAPIDRACFGLLAEDRVLVVERLEPARAQDRLAQPLQPEHEQQAAHRDTQRREREGGQRRAERGDDCGQGDERDRHAESAERQPRVTPTASTMVSASTASTALARNAAATSSEALTGRS